MIDEAPPPLHLERPARKIHSGGERECEVNCCHEKLNPEMCDARDDAISIPARNKTLPFLLIFIRK